MSKQTKPKRDKRAQSTGQTIRVAHKFTHDEFMERNRELAKARDEHDATEEALKANAAELKAKLKSLKARINELINQCRDGAELRETEVLAQFDRRTGMKHYFHHAPGQPQHDEYIRSEAMTEEDCQLLVPEPPEERGRKRRAAEPAEPAEPGQPIGGEAAEGDDGQQAPSE